MVDIATKSAQDRFFDSIAYEPNCGCWLWLGQMQGRGYGQFQVTASKKLGGRQLVLAHRFSYELAKGQIPIGKEIDHLCHVRLCVNPEHLEAVTHTENLYRSKGTIAEKFGNATHCINGHPFDEINTYVRSNGGRSCRVCMRKRSREWQRARRGKVVL